MDGAIALETDRLALREIADEDVAPLQAILSDPLTMVHFPKRFLTQKAVEERIERMRNGYSERGFGLYAVVLKDSGETIGDCGIWDKQIEGREEIELGYHIGREYWNHGYATEAARGCRDYAFGTLGLSRLISLILPENMQSRRVAEKVGLTIEGETIHAELLHYVYSIAKA